MPTKTTPPAVPASTGPRLTPKDSIEALRLLNRAGLIEPDDTPEIKEALLGSAATYLEQKREGHTDLEFIEWYETVDLIALAGQERQEAADPTA